jgi:hypothetical protein
MVARNSVEVLMRMLSARTRMSNENVECADQDVDEGPGYCYGQDSSHGAGDWDLARKSVEGKTASCRVRVIPINQVHSSYNKSTAIPNVEPS